jgi:hypothetical protein
VRGFISKQLYPDGRELEKGEDVRNLVFIAS